MSFCLTGVLALAVAATTVSCNKSSSSADGTKITELTERIDKLEQAQKKFDDVETFIRPIMAQQKAQMAQKAAQEPDPTARFAVDITGNSFEGPAGAAVTIVEAFDFA